MRNKLAWAACGLLVLVVAGGVLAAHSRFTDVTDQHPVDAIEWAADVGITQGCGDQQFCPDEPLSRKHALVFMERFYDQVLGANGDNGFTASGFTRADMMALLKEINDAGNIASAPAKEVTAPRAAPESEPPPTVATTPEIEPATTVPPTTASTTTTTTTVPPTTASTTATTLPEYDLPEPPEGCVDPIYIIHPKTGQVLRIDCA